MTISASSRSTGQDLRYASNASAALPAITTLYPTDSRASAVAFRTNASSSTIRMVFGPPHSAASANALPIMVSAIMFSRVMVSSIMFSLITGSFSVQQINRHRWVCKSDMNANER
jgi:hypothetical protein